MIDRDLRRVGAAIRKVGFLTVAGRGRGDAWRQVRRSCEDGVDVLSASSGTGMGTAFGLAADWIQTWKGQA